jgi:alpha-beta hydrolase superfamily lysophospholipase
MVSLLAAITTSPAIKVPVYLVMGSKDVMFCNIALSCETKEAILLRERLLYTANLDAFVLPNAGHHLNYQKNAPVYYEAVVNWSNKHVGTQ